MTLLIIMLLIAGLSVPAFAQSINPLHPASLTVRIIETESKKGIPGGKVEIYQIAEIVYDSEEFVYELTKAFNASEFKVNAISGFSAAQNAEQAKSLAEFARANSISPVATAVPDENGAAVFADIPLGLYLVVQAEAASEYDTIDAFLITVPQVDGEDYIYDVDAAPKAGTAPAPKPDKPETPDEPKLPQTGQNWMIVFILAGVGVVSFVCGVIRKKRAYHD